MQTLRQAILSTAAAVLLCLSALPSHSQVGITHKGYRGHGAQVTYPGFLAVTEVDADTVSFTYEGAGFLLQRVNTADVASVMTQMRAQLPEGSAKVTSSNGTQLEAVIENGWFLRANATLDQGTTYILYSFGPLGLYGTISQQLVDIQRTLVFDGKPTFGQGGGLTSSSGGCPGCANAIIKTMNNLTQHTAGH